MGKHRKAKRKKWDMKLLTVLNSHVFFLVLGEGRFCPRSSRESNNTEKPEAANVVIDLSIIYSFILNSTLSLFLRRFARAREYSCGIQVIKI